MTRSHALALSGAALLAVLSSPSLAQSLRSGMQCVPDVPNVSMYHNCRLQIVAGGEVCRCAIRPQALRRMDRIRNQDQDNVVTGSINRSPNVRGGQSDVGAGGGAIGNGSTGRGSGGGLAGGGSIGGGTAGPGNGGAVADNGGTGNGGNNGSTGGNNAGGNGNGNGNGHGNGNGPDNDHGGGRGNNGYGNGGHDGSPNGKDDSNR